MGAIYNRYAGQDVGRIAALSDGIFAVAMTLLVLEIHIPEKADIHSEAELWAGLAALSPRFITWLMSLMTLGIFWLGQQTQISHLARADRNLSWLHFIFLAVITALPFSTRLLAEFFAYQTAFFFYWFNILLCGVTLAFCWAYTERAGLVAPDAPPGISQAVYRRIFYAQGLYALGALVGFVSVPWGIALLVLIQLNYAIAPRLPGLWKL